MSRRLRIGLSAGALVAAIGLSGPVRAADSGFCHDYADEAMHQVRAAYDSGRCQFAIDRDPPRWNPDYHAHFDWCRGTSRKDVNRERDARSDILDHCLHDGGPWRHDDDRHW